jgi:hypothetical protein
VIQFLEIIPPLFGALARSPDQPPLEQQEESMNTATVQARSIIAVDYNKSLQDMIAAGKYDWVNPDIAPEKFPVEGTGSKKFRTKLFDFGRHIFSEDAVAAMQNEKFTPGGHVHGLAYGATFPEEQRKYPIASLGSSAQVGGYRCVVCLYGDDAGRGLGLIYWSGDWYDSWHFLGVQEVSAT